MAVRYNEKRINEATIRYTPKMSYKKEKNLVTAGVLAGAIGAGIGVSKYSYGKCFAWNTNINKVLKNFVKNTKLPEFTSTLGKHVGKFAEKGLNLVKSGAEAIAKTTGRQKLLGLLALGTIAGIMAIREHYTKEEAFKDGYNFAEKRK